MKLKIIIMATIIANSFSLSKVKAQITGADKDPNQCIRSAGYMWSDLKMACIRPFELEKQLIQKDNSFIASLLFSASTDSVEVFSKEGQFILTKKKKNYFVGGIGENSFFLEMNNSKWVMGKLDTEIILYAEK